MMLKTFNRLSVLAAVAAALCVSAGIVSADDKKKEVDLKVGDKAPEFKSVDDEGKTWKSADHVGKKILVVYFYPADLTGGCTKQACGFRDDMEQLQGEKVEVVGVSGDSVDNHKLFKKVHKLNFTLLADEDGSVAKSFGVPLRDGGQITYEFEDQTYTLKRGVTAKRWTFVIDQEGKIAHKDTSVNAAKDSETILEVVEKLKKKNS